MNGSTASDAHYDTAVAIVGMSGRFPGARNVEELWQNLLAGVRSIRDYTDAELLAAGVHPQLLSQPNYVRSGTLIEQVDQFDAAFFGYTPREAEVMDPQHRLFLECAWEVLEQAAYDPGSYAGSIGVFAGSSISLYMIHNLFTNPEIMDLAGSLQIDISNSVDALASTISYKFNLRGPSIAVQTYCSTSLVAVHMACQSLLTYECNIALAGGTAISIPHGTGYLYQEGGILSPDGHCRTFDANAQGSVVGNGIGLVALKRMKDALKDGDHIYAVIRGSAVNNDGIRKVGYTAPGLIGQSAVITRALRRAGVKPESISYIETHGTATPLGDSVELSALIKAYTRLTQERQFCALGSVKPNIGHLDRASGVTGLIKAALALKHGFIPPNIDFEAPNPEIGLDASPFYINTTPIEWKTSAGAPRRAGVSSFGLGGTNAHVILEEAPVPPPAAPSRSVQLLVLSAKTASALESQTDQLTTWLKGNPDANLADVAHTLQLGRAGFSHRRAVACTSIADAVHVLEQRDLRLQSFTQTTRDQPVAFLFPGVGDHYAGMAHELYASEPVFRDTVDRCCATLAPLLDTDLRTLLCAPPAESASPQGVIRPRATPAAVAEPLQQTALAQPAVFVVEYALAQLLRSWGIVPQALLGYSLGEYVAATVAGVLGLEDALRLVATRARLIQALPAGAMLAVNLSEDAVAPYLRAPVDLAVVTGPQACVLAGPVAALEAVAARLERDEIAARWLTTSHAFHSQMLAPLQAEVTALAATLRLAAPQIPYVSNVTGTWITAEQATDPGYWAAHMVQTVRFGDGVGVLLENPALVLVEVGPGQALGSFVRQHPACGRDRFGQVLASMPATHERHNELTSLLQTLGRLWGVGVTIDWPGFYAAEARRRVVLPTYPFERQRYWIEPPAQTQTATSLPQPLDTGRKTDPADWFYIPEWKQSPLGPGATEPRLWLVLNAGSTSGDAITQHLIQVGHRVVQVEPGSQFHMINNDHFRVNPDIPADLDLVLETLAARNELPTHVLYLWSLVATPDHLQGSERFKTTQRLGFYGLLDLARAFGARLIDEPVQMIVATVGAQSVDPTDIPHPEAATLLSLCTVISQENATVTVRSIDLPAPDNSGVEPAEWTHMLLGECQAHSDDLRVAYRGGQRLVEEYAPLRLEPAATPILRSEGVYLLTGGLGGVGLVLAEHLARTVQARLVLISRQGLPPRSTWAAYGAAHGPEDATAQRIARVQAIEAAGGSVLVLAADVADPEQMAAAVQATLDHFGALHGVLHAAGISDPGTYLPIQSIGRHECELHFQPKVYGLYALEAALGTQPLDFCVLFSSISSVLGGLGFAGYAAANSFMNAFAHRHTRIHSVPWISVNWDTWHLKEDQYATMGATVAQYEMLPAEGAEAFTRVAAVRSHPQVINSTGDLDTRVRQWVRLESLRDVARNDEPPIPVAAKAPVSNSDYEQRIRAIWQYVLGIEDIGVHDNFFDLGGNSLIALQLVARLKKEFKTQVPAVVIFEAPTISTLVDYFKPTTAPQAEVELATAMLEERRQQARQTVGQDGIAIIGMAGRFPGAVTVDAFWDNLVAGVESLTEFSDDELLAAGVDPLLIHHPDYVKRRPILAQDPTLFDAAFFGYTPREAEFLDPQQRLFHECAWEALELAGYDSLRYPGLIGVFGGTNMNYYHNRLMEDPQLKLLMNESLSLQNDKDALTTYVAYKLDLRGPSFSVQTYCSTSLVATHLACRTLRAGDCDIALAGGVSIRVPVRAGYLYEEGDQASPDGHCRTFDVNAQGATFGDGVAIVVLKRLADALADHDTIHAVIRGSAINNDGGLKVGYTAPSVVGQAAVIQAALADAHLSADALSYVEAHGTATALGDPIEVTALTRAFRASSTAVGTCAISSVKPNVGHLDRAAGATGLIKTALALKHGLIPPTLHFTAPNPEIDFAASPFYVPTTLTRWPAAATPRRAGVNSLGVGGTNAHVIVEEPPPLPPSAPAAHATQLLLLSAKTPSALDTASANLAAFLTAHPDVPLADIAFTLQVGRRTFEHRQVVAAPDHASASAALDGQAPQARRRHSQKATRRDVAFLFPGVGDHAVGMGHTLYASEPVFRTAVDRCCALLTPLLGQPIRTLLYPGAVPAPTAPLTARTLLGAAVARGAEAGPLQQTALAQPAVFVVEYALAQLLRSWGIVPQALLGYSLGEYVAATVAGVLGLEDALRLVATRARLIQALPAGAMLAVNLSEDAVAGYLRAPVDLAVVTGPQACVLAGPVAELEAVAARLERDEIAARWLATSHAFHSQMLAPLQAEVTALAATLRLAAPQIPYVSNVTGTWITAEQATDPGYWAAHMVQTVRFGDGVGVLLENPALVLVEVGPGQALGSFVRQHPACGRERFGQVLATLGADGTHTDLLGLVGELWQQDVGIDWAGVHRGTPRRRVPLPTYPFERQRFWLEPNPQLSAGFHKSVRRPDPGDWCTVGTWKRSIPFDSDETAKRLAQAECWVVLTEGSEFSMLLIDALRAHGQVVATVAVGSRFAAQPDLHFTARADSREDWAAVLQALERHGHTPQHVVHLWLATPPSADDLTDAATTATLAHGFYSLLALTQALGDQGAEQVVIDVVTAEMQEVTGQECLQVARATVLGPCKIIPQEYSGITARSIDITRSHDSLSPRLIEQLIAEFVQAPVGDIIAFRSAHRWIQVFEQIHIPAAPTEHPRLRDQGVYLITGGLGGIALGLAQQLAATCHARLALVGRSPLPPRDTWDALIAADPTAIPAQRVAQIRALEAAGAAVLLLQADVTDPAQIAAAVARTRAHFGALHGVLHTAGVPGVGLLQLKAPAVAAQELAAKVQGTLALTRALAGLPLDFLVLFSSVTSATGGGPGQVAYCAANAFLDAYARRHAHAHGQTVSISWGEWQWDAWSEGLSGFPAEVQARFRAYRKAFGIHFAEGADVLRRILTRKLPHVFVTTDDLVAMVEGSNHEAQRHSEPKQERTSYPRPEVGSSFVEPQSELEHQIAGLWSEVLGIAPIGLNDNFFDLGGNSLMGISLFSRMRKTLKLNKLPAYVMYEAPTIGAQAEYITNEQSPGEQNDQFQPQLDDQAEKRRKRMSGFKKKAQLEDL